MNDLISRQAAIEALAGWKISPIVLDPVPTADVVEVVRCKDCKYYGHYNEEKEDLLWCQFVDTDIDDYCSEGERADT